MDLVLWSSLFVIITASYHTYAQSNLSFSYNYTASSGTLQVTLNGTMAYPSMKVYYQNL